MIKQFLAFLMVTVSLSTAIAQPMDYVSELATPPAPQNYFYGELPKVSEKVSLYGDTMYKEGHIIERKKLILSDNLGFTAGYCTSYVASQRPDLFKGPGDNMISGNAKDWLENAKKAGLLTGTEPKQGAIAVFAPGRGAGGLGHVAIVEYVRDDGLIVVSDMNFVGKHIVTTRIISAHLAQGYIY